MTNTDCGPFKDLVPAISLRENERGREIGAGWDPQWHQPTDVYATYSDKDFRLGLNAAQTTLGADRDAHRRRARGYSMNGYPIFAAGALWLAGIAAASAAPAASAADPHADLVLIHGNIHTQDSGRSVVQAMTLRGNTIVAVGTDQAIGALVGPNTRTIDLRGRLVLPGIIDAHTHPAEGADELGKCSLDDKMLLPAEVKVRVAQCLKEQPVDRDRWYEVVHVNPSGLTLTLRDLDSMLSDHPMLLERLGRSYALGQHGRDEGARIDATTKDPAGGRIEHDAAGQPTGTLRDAASEIVGRAEPSPSIEFETAQLDKAFDAMRATGITSVQDADADEHYLLLYKRLYDAHRLNMRVRATFG